MIYIKNIHKNFFSSISIRIQFHRFNCHLKLKKKQFFFHSIILIYCLINHSFSVSTAKLIVQETTYLYSNSSKRDY